MVFLDICYDIKVITYTHIYICIPYKPSSFSVLGTFEPPSVASAVGTAICIPLVVSGTFSGAQFDKELEEDHRYSTDQFKLEMQDTTS